MVSARVAPRTGLCLHGGHCFCGLYKPFRSAPGQPPPFQYLEWILWTGSQARTRGTDQQLRRLNCEGAQLPGQNLSHAVNPQVVGEVNAGLHNIAENGHCLPAWFVEGGRKLKTMVRRSSPMEPGRTAALNSAARSWNGRTGTGEQQEWPRFEATPASSPAHSVFREGAST